MMLLKTKLTTQQIKDLSNLTPAGKQQVKDLAAWNVVANGETAEKSSRWRYS